MAYYDTEELWFPEWEHSGTPWENPAGLQKHNPVDLVGKGWRDADAGGPRRTRTTGSSTRRGSATFTALQRQGIPSQLLYFPDENHWVLKPANSIQWHETVIDWLDRWLKPTAADPGD